MVAKKKNRTYLLGGLLLFASLFLLMRFGDLAGRFSSNVGFAVLNKAMITDDLTNTLNDAVVAEPFFSRAAVIDPRNLSSHRGLGLSFGLQNNINKALQSFDVLEVEAAVNYSLLGDAARRFNNHERAIFWYEQAVELDPNHYAAWINLGDLYIKTGAASKSIAAYAEAWTNAPSIAFKPYVSALVMGDEISKAEEILQMTLNSDLKFHQRLWGWHTLGQLQQEQGRWNEAYAVYSAGLKEYEQDASLLVSLGWLLYENNRNAAISQFEKAIAEHPDLGAGYFAMGQLMAKEKNYAAAEDWFNSALQRNDSNPRWQLVRANTLRQSGNYDLAVQAYQDTLDKYPTFVSAYYELANTYKMSGSPEQSLQILDQAETRSLNRPLHYYLPAAEIYIWAGRPKQAAAIYQELLVLDPNNREAREQLSQLQDN